MYGLHDALSRLSAATSTAAWRIGHVGSRKGFGVQSPWAYRFVRYVIGERWPYYAYEELAARWPGIDGDTRKLCELYLRIANYCQASKAINYAPPTGAYAEYMQAGCRRMVITDGKMVGDAASPAVAPGASVPLLVRMSVAGAWREFYDGLRMAAHNGTMLIVEGIHKDRAARGLWREIVADDGCTLTFDLGLCGIVYFDDKRYKQHYKVNL